MNEYERGRDQISTIRYILLLQLLILILFAVGCDINSDLDPNDENEKNTDIVKLSDEKDIEEMDNEIVSVERFMEYYNVTETDIPRDYILDFIMQYRFREDTLAKSDYWTMVSADYSNGVIYGTDTGRIFQGTPSSISLEEYIKKADVIVIEFGMYFGGELAYPRRITLDLKNKKIYYAAKMLSDFTDADKCADLSEEDVQSIRDELPKHISEKMKEVSNNNLDYTFCIMMKDSEYNIKGYRGNSGDEINYPGFDAYWKELYQKKFDEEFVFNKYEGNE